MSLTDKLTELQRLCDAASQGPWHQWEKEWIVGPTPSLESPGCNEGIAYTVGNNLTRDAAFIAASRTAMPQLVEALGISFNVLQFYFEFHGSDKNSPEGEALARISEILEVEW